MTATMVFRLHLRGLAFGISRDHIRRFFAPDFAVRRIDIHRPGGTSAAVYFSSAKAAMEACNSRHGQWLDYSFRVRGATEHQREKTLHRSVRVEVFEDFPAASRPLQRDEEFVPNSLTRESVMNDGKRQLIGRAHWTLNR